LLCLGKLPAGVVSAGFSLEQTMIDLETLDHVGASETPFELQMKDAAGNLMEFWVSIIGSDAEKVQKFTLRRLNEQRRANAIKVQKGKLGDVDPLESDIDFAIEAAVIRTVGWRGAKQQFTADLARVLYRRNPHMRQQIIDESNNAANFTKARPSS